MSKQFNVSYLISALLSTQPEKLLTRPTRLMLTVLCGFVLISLWQLVMAPPIHSHVVTVTDGPLCIRADLEVTKTVIKTTPNEGDTILYTITVTNNGPDDATGAQLTDVLPTGVTFGGYTATQGTYNSTTGLWTVGNLDNTASATLTITATVDSGTCGMTIANTASVTANQPDPTPDNNEDSVAITVSCADLEVAKTVNNATPNVSDAIAYTITVTDNGPDDATGVQITDKLPTGVIFGGYTATQGTYNSTTGLWKGGNVANTASATLTITATVDSGTGGRTITNTAHSLTADQPDPNPDNNEASAVITPTSAVYGLYLPIICRNYCRPFTATLTYPIIWPITNNAVLKTEYIDGEYRMLTKDPFPLHYAYQLPDYFTDYEIEVNAHWDSSTSTGEGYGIIFGLTSKKDAYVYLVNADRREYELRRYLGGSKYSYGWVRSNAIRDSSLATNTLKVIRSGSRIKLYVNGEHLRTVTDDAIKSGRVGLSVLAYYDDLDYGTRNADVRFNNYILNTCVGTVSSIHAESNPQVSIPSTGVLPRN